MVSNYYGQLGLGHNRDMVTVPEEIATPEAAEGYTLTDVQSAVTVVHFSLMKKTERESFLLVVRIGVVS